MDHTYDIIIYRVIGAPRHGREIVDGIYTTDKIFIPLLMKNSQFLGSKGYNYQMEIYTTIQKEDVSLEKQFQKHMSNIARKNGVINRCRY